MKRLALMLCVASCGDSTTSGPTVRFSLPASGLPAPLAVPFPSDIYKTDPDGTIVDTLTDWSLVKVTMPDPSAFLGNGYSVLDGFGRQSGAIFSLDGLGVMDAVDVATLDGHTAVIDLETGAPLPSTAGWDAYTKCIVVMPEDVLAAGHRYAALVTSDVKLENGVALGATAAFRAVKDPVYTDAISAGIAAGFPKTTIIAATSWTTSTVHRKLKPIRDALAAGTYGAAPTLLTTTVAAPYHYVRFGSTAHTGWTATLDEWLGTARKDAGGNDITGLPDKPEPTSSAYAHDALGAVITGAYVSPEFRRPFTMTTDPSDGTIAYDASGNAIVQNANAQVPVTIFLPKGPVPAGGFPVVIFQHGLGGQRSNAFSIANEFARAGIATAAIDAPWHGLRASDAGDSAGYGGTYNGPDGFADGSNPLALLSMAGYLRSFIAAGDNYFQAVLDLAQLRRLLSSCDLSAVAAEYGGTAPTLDTTHVGLFGWSLGAEISTIFAAVEPRSSLDPVVVDAPGTALAKDVADSPIFNQQTTLLAAQAEVPSQTLDAGHYAAVLHLIQGIADRAEPGAYAEDVDHDVWMFRGNMDETVPARWSNTLARALGATQLTPALAAIERLPQGGATLAGSKVVAFFEAAPAGHGVLTVRYNQINFEPPYPRDADPLFVAVPTPYPVRPPIVAAQAAVIQFYKSTWAGAPAIDVSTIAPVADGDDDGFCDSEDTDPFNPTVHPSGTGHCVRDVGFSFP